MTHLQSGLRWIAAGVMCLALAGCAGAIVGTAADIAIETAKIPFKVVGAVADVAVPDSED